MRVGEFAELNLHGRRPSELREVMRSQPNLYRNARDKRGSFDASNAHVGGVSPQSQKSPIKVFSPENEGDSPKLEDDEEYD